MLPAMPSFHVPVKITSVQKNASQAMAPRLDAFKLVPTDYFAVGNGRSFVNETDSKVDSDFWFARLVGKGSRRRSFSFISVA